MRFILSSNFLRIRWLVELHDDKSIEHWTKRNRPNSFQNLCSYQTGGLNETFSYGPRTTAFHAMPILRNIWHTVAVAITVYTSSLSIHHYGWKIGIFNLFDFHTLNTTIDSTRFVPMCEQIFCSIFHERNLVAVEHNRGISSALDVCLYFSLFIS